MTRSTTCSTTMVPEPDQDGDRPAGGAPTSKHTAASTAATPTTNGQYAPRRRGGRSGTGPRGRWRRGTRAARVRRRRAGRRPTAPVRAPPATREAASARRDGDADDDAHREPTWPSRNRPSSLASTRNSRAVGEGAPTSPVSIRRPSIVVGALDAEQVSTVGATSMMLTNPARGSSSTQQPGLEPGCAHRRHGERVGLAGGAGPTTITASCGGRRARAAGRRGDRCRAARGADLRSPAPRTRTGREIGAHEVGALDQHHRARRPGVGERGDHRVVVSRTPNGAVGSCCSRSASTCPPGTLPASSSARRPRRGATARTASPACSGRCRHRWRSTARAIAGAASSSPRSPTSAPDSSASFGLGDAGDRQVHEPVAGGDARCGW